MTPETGNKLAGLICVVVIAIAVTGYFVGLQSPMNPAGGNVGDQPQFSSELRSGVEVSESSSNAPSRSGQVIPATHYADMPTATSERTKVWRTSLSDLTSTIDPLAEITITPEQKAIALEFRERNRAFNGAPPTIPHPVDQMTSQACVACHGEGAKTETLRISKMSHQFLTNCTQCHVESDPQILEEELFRANSFVGLPAPEGGPRAYEGAPPMIPHSTWMRVECSSCHGVNGEQGIRTTHPWRQNCQQCHAPSSELDQNQIPHQPEFLAPPVINSSSREQAPHE